ncbi:hypothetical protein VNO77_03953 [Canavalia gladiata]|uniref:Uncharacterized protein n=1 Tax=Canavalia gladiata TaxID=3824 RepID=A0AAN9R4D8_CANGL
MLTCISSSQAASAAVRHWLSPLLKIADAEAQGYNSDKDWYGRFMPLTEVIMEFFINRSLIKMIEQVVDEDGSVKDSASLALKQSRQQVQVIERKLHLDDIEKLLNNLIQLDVINARATYGLSFGGSSPHIFLSDRNGSSSTIGTLTKNDKSYGPLPSNKEWKLYLPKAYHPLLLQRHRENLQKAKRDVNLATLVAAPDNAHPVPVDFLVLASEPAQIPWFDSVFADIGNEQSLSQSLSTFSGHLKQNIKSQSQLQPQPQSVILLTKIKEFT